LQFRRRVKDSGLSNRRQFEIFVRSSGVVAEATPLKLR